MRGHVPLQLVLGHELFVQLASTVFPAADFFCTTIDHVLTSNVLMQVSDRVELLSTYALVHVSHKPTASVDSLRLRQRNASPMRHWAGSGRFGRQGWSLYSRYWVSIPMVDNAWTSDGREILP